MDFVLKAYCQIICRTSDLIGGKIVCEQVDRCKYNLIISKYIALSIDI